MRRSVLILAFAGFFAILVLSLNTSAQSSGTGTIHGTVSLYEYGETPIEDAEVFLIQNSTIIDETTTDSNGEFYFYEVEPGDYFLMVKSEHGQADKTVMVDEETPSIVRIWYIESGPYPGDDDDSDDSGANMMLIAGICVAFVFIGMVIFIVLIVSWGNYSKITSQKLMEHETRQRILDYLQTNPGGHLRGIKEELALPMGVLTHHIYKMEAEDVIKSRMEGKYRRFYPYNHKIVKAPLLTGTQKKIYEQIEISPGVTPPDIAFRLGKSRKTIYYHVQELEAKGAIRVDRSEKQFKCFVLQET